MILLIDNYDSFVHNLARYVREMGLEATVVRNDQWTVDDVIRSRPAAIILSPGPCTPDESGICVPLIRELRGQIPILGVCLGHQAIAAAAGARIVRAPAPVHGRSSPVLHQGTPLFDGISSPFLAARYHSLIIDESTLPRNLEITARTTDGIPMAVEGVDERLWGVQFHPESILTQAGHRLLANFFRLSGLEVTPVTSGDVNRPRRSDSGQPAPLLRPVAWPDSLEQTGPVTTAWDQGTQAIQDLGQPGIP